MPFYTGKTKDGSDMREVGGMFVSPDGKEWSNQPYTREEHLQEKEEARQHRIYLEIREYCNGRYSFRDAYNQVIAKTAPLSARCKKYLIQMFKDEQNEQDTTNL